MSKSGLTIDPESPEKLLIVLSYKESKKIEIIKTIKEGMAEIIIDLLDTKVSNNIFSLLSGFFIHFQIKHFIIFFKQSEK